MQATRRHHAHNHSKKRQRLIAAIRKLFNSPYHWSNHVTNLIVTTIKNWIRRGRTRKHQQRKTQRILTTNSLDISRTKTTLTKPRINYIFRNYAGSNEKEEYNDHEPIGDWETWNKMFNEMEKTQPPSTEKTGQYAAAPETKPDESRPPSPQNQEQLKNKEDQYKQQEQQQYQQTQEPQQQQEVQQPQELQQQEENKQQLNLEAQENKVQMPEPPQPSTAPPPAPPAAEPPQVAPQVAAPPPAAPPPAAPPPAAPPPAAPPPAAPPPAEAQSEQAAQEQQYYEYPQSEEYRGTEQQNEYQNGNPSTMYPPPPPPESNNQAGYQANENKNQPQQPPYDSLQKEFEALKQKLEENVLGIKMDNGNPQEQGTEQPGREDQNAQGTNTGSPNDQNNKLPDIQGPSAKLLLHGIPLQKQPFAKQEAASEYYPENLLNLAGFRGDGQRNEEYKLVENNSKSPSLAQLIKQNEGTEGPDKSTFDANNTSEPQGTQPPITAPAPESIPMAPMPAPPLPPQASSNQQDPTLQPQDQTNIHPAPDATPPTSNQRDENVKPEINDNLSQQSLLALTEQAKNALDALVIPKEDTRDVPTNRWEEYGKANPPPYPLSSLGMSEYKSVRYPPPSTLPPPSEQDADSGFKYPEPQPIKIKVNPPPKVTSVLNTKQKEEAVTETIPTGGGKVFSVRPPVQRERPKAESTAHGQPWPLTLKIRVISPKKGKYIMRIKGPFDSNGKKPHRPELAAERSLPVQHTKPRVIPLRSYYPQQKQMFTRARPRVVASPDAKFIPPIHQSNIVQKSSNGKVVTRLNPLVYLKVPKNHTKYIELTTNLPHAVAKSQGIAGQPQTNAKGLSIKLPFNVSLSTVLRNIYEHMFAYYLNKTPEEIWRNEMNKKLPITQPIGRTLHSNPTNMSYLIAKLKEHPRESTSQILSGIRGLLQKKLPFKSVLKGLNLQRPRTGLKQLTNAKPQKPRAQQNRVKQINSVSTLQNKTALHEHRLITYPAPHPLTISKKPGVLARIPVHVLNTKLPEIIKTKLPPAVVRAKLPSLFRTKVPKVLMATIHSGQNPRLPYALRNKSPIFQATKLPGVQSPQSHGLAKSKLAGTLATRLAEMRNHRVPATAKAGLVGALHTSLTRKPVMPLRKALPKIPLQSKVLPQLKQAANIKLLMPIKASNRLSQLATSGKALAHKDKLSPLPGQKWSSEYGPGHPEFERKLAIVRKLTNLYPSLKTILSRMHPDILRRKAANAAAGQKKSVRLVPLRDHIRGPSILASHFQPGLRLTSMKKALRPVITIKPHQVKTNLSHPAGVLVRNRAQLIPQVAEPIIRGYRIQMAKKIPPVNKPKAPAASHSIGMPSLRRNFQQRMKMLQLKEMLRSQKLRPNDLIHAINELKMRYPPINQQRREFLQRLNLALKTAQQLGGQYHKPKLGSTETTASTRPSNVNIRPIRLKHKSLPSRSTIKTAHVAPVAVLKPVHQSPKQTIKKALARGGVSQVWDKRKSLIPVTDKDVSADIVSKSRIPTNNTQRQVSKAITITKDSHPLKKKLRELKRKRRRFSERSTDQNTDHANTNKKTNIKNDKTTTNEKATANAITEKRLRRYKRHHE